LSWPARTPIARIAATSPAPLAEAEGGNRPVQRIRLGFCQAAISGPVAAHRQRQPNDLTGESAWRGIRNRFCDDPNKGTLEKAQAMAAHASPRTTKLYDRTSDQITLDEIEKIVV